MMAALLTSIAARAAAEDAAPLPADNATPAESANTGTLIYPWSAPGSWLTYGRRDFDIRFGYWGTAHSGSMEKTGEYQSLDPSPFYDIDGISSDGERTLNLTITGQDSEANTANIYFFRPGLTAKIDYDRYLRRLDTDTFNNFDPNLPAAPSSARILNHDVLNAGQDYALRVQEFDAKFKGDITENLRWKLNTWGMRKQGDRQVSKLAHCYNPGSPANSRCHIQAQSQSIDWMTTEVEPVLEAKLGVLTAEYSRTMRAFDQNDSIVTRRYTSNHGGWPLNGVDVPYADTPDNFTQIDRMKLSADLNDDNHIYALMYTGDTKNKDLDTHRGFNGYDLRLTNESIDGVKVTAYGKQSNENNTKLTTSTGFVPDTALINGGFATSSLWNPVNYHRTGAGLNGRWQPYQSGWPSAPGLAIISGYDYNLIGRTFADYSENGNAAPFFTQPDTVSNLLNVGASMRWNSKIDTAVKYKWGNFVSPTYGVSPLTGDVNSNLPTHQDIVELSGTLMPTETFLLSGTVGLERRTHYSLVNNNNPTFLSGAFGNPRETDFVEDSFPITLTAWWAASDKWSFNAGYSSFSDWIDQLITLGDQYTTPVAYQSRWGYSGKSQGIDLGGAYTPNSKWKFSGGYGYVWGNNLITNNPSPAGADWSTIPVATREDVITHKINSGVDYAWRERVSLYFRYNFFDFVDLTGPQSGVAHMFLGGVNASF